MSVISFTWDIAKQHPTLQHGCLQVQHTQVLRATPSPQPQEPSTEHISQGTLEANKQGAELKLYPHDPLNQALQLCTLQLS